MRSSAIAAKKKKDSFHTVCHARAVKHVKRQEHIMVMVITGQRQRSAYMIVDKQGHLGIGYNNHDKAISQNGWLRPLEG